MNIVHLIPYYAPAWGFGGVVRAAHGLTTALARQGHQVTVITTDASDAKTRLPAGETAIDDVRVIRCRNAIPALRGLNLSTPRGLRRALQETLPSADILHVHEFRTIENLIGLGMARQHNIPALLSPHGTLPYSAGRSAIKRGWDRLLGRWTARRIDHIIALTADEADDARVLWSQFRLTLPDSRLSVIPNGVNITDFATLPPRDTFRQRWHIPSHAPLILFLARLHERKGAHHLIDALPTLPEAHLALVGPDEGQRADLRAQAARLDVTERITFTGLLTGPDKLAAFSGADVLALPAVGEGLPMVALEAMAAGLPVALSDGCHLPEVFAAGAGVRLESLTGGDIAAVLGPLLADESRRREMGRQGRALVARTFTWDAVAAQSLAVYASCRA